MNPTEEQTLVMETFWRWRSAIAHLEEIDKLHRKAKSELESVEAELRVLAKKGMK